VQNSTAHNAFVEALREPSTREPQFRANDRSTLFYPKVNYGMFTVGYADDAGLKNSQGFILDLAFARIAILRAKR
jgi:hypothetical protein